MAKQQAMMQNTFKLKHTLDGEKHILTIIPKFECEFEPLPIEISAAQWDMMRFHFALAENPVDKISFLCYFK